MYFYGLGECAESALKSIKEMNQLHLLNGVIDSHKKGKWNGIDIVDLCNINRKEIIIITVQNTRYVKQIWQILKEQRFENIYFYNFIKPRKDFLVECCTQITDWGDSVLPQVEMHIANHCNLNCKGCTHYSPIFEKSFPDFDQQIKDIKILKNKFSHIIRFYLLGGEPLLNQNIGKYITEIKEILPKTDLWIVTNGLLLLSISENILDTISKYNVIVSISEYEPTHQIIDKIKQRLDKYDVSYNIRAYQKKQTFIKPLSLSENSKYKKTCISDGCVNIANGKIARCPSLMYIDKLNSYFNINLPNEGIMDLESCPSGNELIECLQNEVELCKHCVENKIEWQQCDIKNLKLDDFVTKL